MSPLAELPAIYFPAESDDSSCSKPAFDIAGFGPPIGSSLYFEPLTARSESLLSALAASGEASLEAITEAARFLELLPVSVPDPAIIVEDDGQIGLDWREGDKSLSLSLGHLGMIGYSALFGAESAYGRVPFSRTDIPGRIAPFLASLVAERQTD